MTTVAGTFLVNEQFIANELGNWPTYVPSNKTYSTGNIGIGNYSSPVQIPGTWLNFAQASTPSDGPSYIDNNNYLWTWNSNTSSMVQFSNSQKFASVYRDGTHNLWALDNSGYIWVQGTSNGAFSISGGATSYSTLTKLGNKIFKSIIPSCGIDSIAAIDINNQIWVAGSNYNANLGVGTSYGITSSSYITLPVLISGVWLSGSCSGNHSMYINSINLLYASGKNNYGQLGTGNYIDITNVTQVSTSNWSTISCSIDGSSFGITTDGTLWTCGRNNFGQLGTGDTINRNTFTKLPGLWTSVTSVYGSVYAISNVGALYTWGSNNFGQLGTGDTINRSTPTMVPGLNWLSATAEFSGAMLIKLS